MSAEIICVGTELLLGDILNRNAQFLAKELAALGIPHFYQSVVGDNVARLQEVIATAAKRANILIFTGGLGPTPDDLTVETIADYFQTPLTERQEIIADIQAKFASRGRVMSASNRKQALLPEGSAILPNPTGTAPGIIWQPQENLTILTFPGVPREMHRMWQDTAIPFLRSIGYGRDILHSESLHFWNIAESTLAEKVSHLLDLQNPTVAPYAGEGEVRLRICARAKNIEEAKELIVPIAAEIKNIVGLDYYGSDDDNLASIVGKMLKNRGQTISIAESCTGGNIGSFLTSIPGSSDYFWGGIVAYDNSVKIRCLDIDPTILATEGAVSMAVAEGMALGVQSKLGTDWAISITGIAGPDGGTQTKPVGLVYIGIAKDDRTAKAFKYLCPAYRDREYIRTVATKHSLDLLRRELMNSQKN
jgi:nicotinamide-nucleotide amidase